jgi:lipopolysaccharide transport system ATP-binding protein
MEPAIKIEGVSKRYRLGTGLELGGKLSQRMEAAVRAPIRRLLGRPSHREQRSDFWALRDVSLEVQRGEILGLIGANGAGKSTLLKLLAHVTPPTEGRLTLRGNVGSLLEVGTGFNPELTGRENVYLNGAILGMKRREIIDRFDDIVEFSGVERFLDTPVKRYSSGMLVRLGFAVAAHLEPEILLVDEVLAVGDAEFQRKCLGKIEDVAGNDGRTILFVSHNMDSVRRLCDRALLLEHGRVSLEGSADDVVTTYLEHVRPVQHGGVSEIRPNFPRVGTGEAKLTRVALLDSRGQPTGEVRFGEPVTVVLTFRADEPVGRAAALVGISTPDGSRILTTASTDGGKPMLRLEAGTTEVRAELQVVLLPGEFVIDASIMHANGTTIDYVERALSFAALNVPPEGSEDHYQFPTVLGYVRPDSDWSVTESAEDLPREVGSVR